MNDDIIRFFSRSTHCTPQVLHNIVFDIDALCSALKLQRKSIGFGSLQQPKMCLYGALPVQFCSNENQFIHVKIPMQIWLSHQYPIQPPTIYIITTTHTLQGPCYAISNCNQNNDNYYNALLFSSSSYDYNANSQYGAHQVCASCVSIHCNHPNVDITGLCYCSQLAHWHPIHSSLCNVIQCLGHEIQQSQVCPLCYVKCRQCIQNDNFNKTSSNLKISDIKSSQLPSHNYRITSTIKNQKGIIQSYMSSPQQHVNIAGTKIELVDSENAKCIICYQSRNVVLIPCGHYCLCESCATNVQQCPLCRTRIQVRQRVIHSN